MYLGEVIYDIDLNPIFWDKINIENIPFEQFIISVFNKSLTPRYIPDEDIKNWIDNLIKDCPLYYNFMLNFYKFKFNTDNKGEFYKQNDGRNLYRFNFDSFYEMIQELIDYYDLDLKLFLTNFNKMFRYYIDDFKNESKIKNGLINFSKCTGVDLNNLNRDYMITLLKLLAKYPFSPQVVSFNLDGPTFYHNIETVFLQYWYEVQTSKKERIFSDKRQLSWLDFDMEVIKELSHETIKEMLLMLCEVGITEYELFDIKEYGRQYAKQVLSDKTPYKTIEELFSDDKIDTCIETVKELIKKGIPPLEFKDGVYHILKDIMDECKLIEMIIRLNELIITYIKSEEKNDYDKIISSLDKMTPKIGKNINIKDDFTPLTTHTFCLFIQICITVLDNPDIHPILKSIAENFSKDCKQYKNYYTCLETNQGNKFYVYCEHRTIHYYTFKKWWYMYIALIEKFYNQKFSEMNLNEYYQRTFQVWYPKSSYCDKCYNQYKNLEEVVNNTTKGLVSYIPKDNDDLLAHKFLVVVMKSKIPKYRAIYNENCDIPLYTKDDSLIKAYDSHKKEIKNKINNVSVALTDLLKSIRQETEKIINLYD